MRVLIVDDDAFVAQSLSTILSVEDGQDIRPGDVVWIPPGEKHWHGAAPTTGMSHIAIHEALDGDYATWMEHVSDAQYAAAPQAD